MGASSSIQEYGEEVLLAATEGNVVKLMEVLATGDKIVQDTEDATKELLLKELNTDNGGGIAVHIGCFSGNAGVVSALAEYGVSVNSANKFGDSPLHAACAKGHHGVIGVLLARDADLKATDVQGRTPLFVAARGGHQLVVQHLLKHKAKLGINATNKSGRTALMAAYLNDHTEVVQMLLTAGANLWVKDANNKRVLDLALDKSDGTAAALFLKYDQSVTTLEAPPALDDEGRLALIAAVAPHTGVKVLKMEGVPISEAVFKAIVLMLRANAVITEVKVDGPKLVESLEKLTDINFQLTQELDTEMATATMMMAVAIGKLKAAEVLLQRPKDKRANPQARYSSGDSVHAIALRYASIQDSLIPILFYYNGVIDAGVGLHLSQPHQRRVVVQALSALENAKKPWRHPTTGGTVLHMLMNAFAAGHVADEACVATAVAVLGRCPKLMDVPDKEGALVSEMETLPEGWPFFNVKRLASKVSKEVIRRSLLWHKRCGVGDGKEDADDASNLAQAFCAVSRFSGNYDDVFSRWTNAQPEVLASTLDPDKDTPPGSIVMDGEVVTASLRAVHALGSILDAAAENEAEIMGHVTFLEEAFEGQTLELEEAREKVAELEKKVKLFEIERKESKRGFLDIGW